MPIRQHFTFSRLAKAVSVAAAGLLLSATTAWADITNPAIGKFGNDAAGAASGALFTSYFVNIWKVGINGGGILVLVQFASGAIDWITSSGEKAKLESARGKMIQAAIGIIILVSLFTIIGFFSNMVFGNDFNLLRLTFGGGSSSSGGSGGSGGGGSGLKGCGNETNVQYEFPANSYQCFDFNPKNCKHCNGATGLFEAAPDMCPSTSNCAP